LFCSFAGAKGTASASTSVPLDDLDGFSEELVEKMRYLMREYE
jgi:hypothetical protein